MSSVSHTVIYQTYNVSQLSSLSVRFVNLVTVRLSTHRITFFNVLRLFEVSGNFGPNVTVDSLGTTFHPKVPLRLKQFNVIPVIK